MRTNFYIFAFFLFANKTLIHCQNNSTSYKISVMEFPQTIELYKKSNGQYYGHIETKLSKGMSRRGWAYKTWRKIWNIKDQIIRDIRPIDSLTVKKLMIELKENGIDCLTFCKEDEDSYNKGFLDSGYTSFTIEIDGVEKNFSFEEIYPIKGLNLEKGKLRLKVQKLMTVLYNYLDLENEFSTYINRLPRGNYTWFEGSGNKFVTIKKK